MPAKSGKQAGELDFMDMWYPKGFFVSFEFSSDALREVDAFFRREHRVIVPLTVREILDESIAQKLA